MSELAYDVAPTRSLNSQPPYTRGVPYIHRLAKDMFDKPELAAKLTAAAHLPGVKASLVKAAALNAPKLALLRILDRCKTRGALFVFLDLPYKLHRLDPERHGELGRRSWHCRFEQPTAFVAVAAEQDWTRDRDREP